ncbi:294_t:CDS:2 [Funneliformis mosseae]|uniref:294_t:CDS:1 n=1 Tax=Funneliformis mosseae TaxID=27381 RepID=A0A9N8VTA6_FUNMO|nr:294_t:CDS:2 [Funneliformis mosseae]
MTKFLCEYESSDGLIRQYREIRREEVLLGKNVQEDRRDIMSLFLLKYSIIKNQDGVDRKMAKREKFEDVTM